ncbi:4-hydroxy-3-methylbut-2-enyl diphosphate reductase [Streptomyces rimosus]|uniref:4-hydroxy-3-methylbut-2-enyl diphosphate reductase n=1 Tax=Streptomyces rimosus TaxID=1927 RepID=UPI00099EDD0B|nr:4-hydroxy-3-methylbut-2-enyl diphosphate reductase [Streptomyces rimosus]
MHTEILAVRAAGLSLGHGQAVVATSLERQGDARPLRSRVAPLLQGALRRRGLVVQSGPLQAVPPSDAKGPVLVAATYTPHGGTEQTAAVAVAPQDRAARAAVQSALRELEDALRSRAVLLASPRSFCAGVDRAIEIVERVLAQEDAPVYVRKQIVHNVHVVRDLERRGAVFVDELDEVPPAATVVFSAHGVSPDVRAAADRRELRVIDATCPLVTKVHAEARRFAGRGDTVVFIGHAGHEETEGTLGEAPDRMVLVESVADVAALQVPDPTRVSYLTQTTLAVDETTEVIKALRERFPALRAPHSEDICYATTNRQEALRAVAADSDLVFVVGSVNSSNSQRLVELSTRQGTPAQLIDDASEVDPRWLREAATVGLTAGASAPPRLVEQVIDSLAGLGAIHVEEREVTQENVQFALPRAVRAK